MLKIANTLSNKKRLIAICNAIEIELNNTDNLRGTFSLFVLNSEATSHKWYIEVTFKEKNSKIAQRYWFNCHSCLPVNTIPAVFKNYYDISDRLKHSLSSQFPEEPY